MILPGVRVYPHFRHIFKGIDNHVIIVISYRYTCPDPQIQRQNQTYLKFGNCTTKGSIKITFFWFFSLVIRKIVVSSKTFKFDFFTF